MQEILGEPLSLARMFFLILALVIACGFEFVNGFHDTANAVATVIYTKSLKPWPAVLWSGLCNFLGCLLGGTAVAFSIVYLLPVDLLVAIGSRTGLAMVMALLLGAILWNLGTWYLGLPASSSHTLIGSILGVGLANSFLPGHTPFSGVNWEKAREVGLSLLVSPLAGFAVAGALLLATRVLLKRHGYLHTAPKADAPPPLWVRAILILTCTGVSFAHGSNDGQKGVGLIMLILIGILPVNHALNPGLSADKLGDTTAIVRRVDDFLAREGANPAVAAAVPN
ncbi:MAG: inorganic phosphate transporter, partial [Armatimonadetes bacterium]|nr:inorganic phosphate transporter [Armatimonadota bacterium]